MGLSPASLSKGTGLSPVSNFNQHGAVLGMINAQHEKGSTVGQPEPTHSFVDFEVYTK